VSKEQDERDSISPLICAIRAGSLTILELFYEGPKPSLAHNPGILYSPSAYATALTLGRLEIVGYLEVCIDRDGDSSPQILESDTYANMSRKIMEIMSNIHHLYGSSASGIQTEIQPKRVYQIALHILPLAGANFDSDRTCELVEEAQHLCPVIHAVCGEDRAGLLEKALPRLVRTIREEADPEKRSLFLDTLEVAIDSHIASQLNIQRSAYIDKLRESQLLVLPGMNTRPYGPYKALGCLWDLVRENTDNDGDRPSYDGHLAASSILAFFLVSTLFCRGFAFSKLVVYFRLCNLCHRVFSKSKVREERICDLSLPYIYRK
jgi:hypothetical protein